MTENSIIRLQNSESFLFNNRNPKHCLLEKLLMDVFPNVGEFEIEKCLSVDFIHIQA